jgi:CheY-like chemotaxis protein
MPMGSEQGLRLSVALSLDWEMAMLSGSRVLVVEDEAITAEEIRLLLVEAEGVPVGPVASLSEARRLLKEGTPVDAALLDVNVSDGTITPVLEALSARGIPALVYTGGSLPADVRQRHPDLIALSKPVAPARLIAELRRLMGKLGSPTQLASH